MTLAQWRSASGLSDSNLRKLAGITFLAPDIQRAIVAGRAPAGLMPQQLIQTGVPLAWVDQRAALGF